MMSDHTKLRFHKELDDIGIAEIKFLINNKIDESHNLEYKGASSNPHEDCELLSKTISGFLNTDGGIMIYGVSEKKGNKHRYPIDIRWCSVTKETLENISNSKTYVKNH